LTYWSKAAGRKFYKTTIFKAISDFSEEANLGDGRIADRPYRSNLVAEAYTKGTALKMLTQIVERLFENSAISRKLLIN